jgi:hypothetical protein
MHCKVETPNRTVDRIDGTSGHLSPPGGLAVPRLPVRFLNTCRVVARLNPWSSHMPSAIPVPRDFLCEHAPSKSRVFAVLIPPRGPKTLKAVLTCTDPVLAQRAADTLAALARSGGGDAINANAEDIAAALPAAPAASFREACHQLREQKWPETDAGPVRWDQFHPADEGDRSPARRDEATRTPADARLGELTGKAFRVMQFIEFHVHDASRLLAAARAGGFSPSPDEDDQNDPDDLLGAVMHMADTSHEVPGADIISQESTGQPLIVAEADELADWQEDPITAEFSSGWRLRRNESGNHEQAGPDFAALFPVRSCPRDHADEDEEGSCEICGDWYLSPRSADMLYTALENLSDEAYDDADEFGDEPVPGKNAGDWSFFDRLPRVTWKMDAEWRRQVGRACEDLAQDLAAGDWPRPRCTAEEMAMHLAIQDAPTYLEIWQDGGDKRHESLPEHRNDYDWHMCSQVLFEDHDVLMLYNARLDGFEDPDSDLNREYGVGDLRPAAWFKTFAHLEPRDPHRGFRR